MKGCFVWPQKENPIRVRARTGPKVGHLEMWKEERLKTQPLFL
jgi:hypothetical protein